MNNYIEIQIEEKSCTCASVLNKLDWKVLKTGPTTCTATHNNSNRTIKNPAHAQMCGKITV
jgi:hypothetical protein